jgi:hypothetical protein
MRWRDVPLVGWISYVPLLGVLAAVVACVLGAGAAVGAPQIIWHDLGGTQLWAGFAVATLCVHLGIVGYLLDSVENPDQNVAPDGATDGSVARYVLWPVGTLLLALLFGLLRQGETRYHGLGVVVGPVVVVAGLAWLALGPWSRRPISHLLPTRWIEALAPSIRRRHESRRRGAPPIDAGAHAVQIVLMLALAVVYVAICLLERERIVPAAVAVSVALSLATGVWGSLRFWMRRFRLVGIALLLLAACVFGATRDRAVTGLSHVSFPDGDPPRRLLFASDALEHWRGSLGETKPPLVVVTTSGGALRAAVWTINVLGQLEGRLPGFLRHVRIITGASGGMVGAAHLVSALAERGNSPAAPKLDGKWFDGIMEDAGKDSLTPITRALILPLSDRGTALEDSWEREGNRRMAKPFRDLMPGEDAGWLPSLIYSPMLVEDGRRLVVSNLDLDAITKALQPWAAVSTTHEPSTSSVQLFACRGDGIDAIKLNTVARLNATFPWITSAARLTSDPDRRVVDAGYYDNYGVDIATAWLRVNAPWIEANTSGVLLVQIRDAESHAGEVEREKTPGLALRWVSGLTTPVEAILSAREASMSFRNDQKVDGLSVEPPFAPELVQPPFAPKPGLLATEVFGFPMKAPLNWYLDRASLDRLKSPAAGAALEAVATWWDAHHRAAP